MSRLESGHMYDKMLSNRFFLIIECPQYKLVHTSQPHTAS